MPSGLGEFFRGSRTEEVVTGNALQVPAESPVRKRGSRIPFLGRTRKKSAISDGAPASESELEDSRGDERQESTSFASKLAANFTPSKSKPPSARRSSRSLASDSLSPPPVTSRSPSVDSSSSRATTPRPTITVSHDLSEYEDLFTRPKRKSTVSIATEGSNSSQINFPVLTESETGTSASQRSSSFSKAHLDTIVRRLGPLADDSDRTLTNSNSLSPIEKRRSFPANPFRPEKTRTGAAAASPLKMFSNPTQPPTEPLPSPPTTPTAFVPSRKSLSALPQRPRAQTLSSVTQSPPTVKHNANPAVIETKPPDTKLPEGESLDIDAASLEQLRLALKAKIVAFDELSNRLAKVTEAHQAEKSFLEKRVATLEKDALRKDKEIKGLTWLLMNNRPASNAGGANVIAGNLSETASKSMTSLLEGKDGKGSARLPQYRRLGAEDSGAESSQMSGAESPYSGTESSSSFPAKRVKRYKLLDARSNLSRSISMKPFRANEGLGIHNTIPNLPSLPKSVKRSSVSSLASSTSTSSSLLSPSPTPTVMAHLSAIPEAPTTPPPKPPPPFPLLPSLRSSRDPAIVAAIHAAERLREKEEHRSNRSSKTAIPSQTPAAAYAANLKRGLAPSIEQVLGQSGAAESKQEKLEPDTKTLPTS